MTTVRLLNLNDQIYPLNIQTSNRILRWAFSRYYFVEHVETKFTLNKDEVRITV